MRINLFVAFFLLSGTLVHANNKPCKITLALENYPASAEISFARIPEADAENVELGKTKLVKGRGIFQFDLDKGAFIKMTDTKSEESIYLFAEPGSMLQVSGTFEDKKDKYRVVGPGSATHNLFMRYSDSAAGAKNEYDESETDDLRNESRSKLSGYLLRFGQSNVNSYAPALLLYFYRENYENNIAELDAILKQSRTEVREHYWGKKVADYVHLNEGLQVGKYFDDFDFTDLENKTVRIKEFRGNYLLIDCWATWCGPCVKEIPYLTEAYAIYGKSGFSILGVSFDKEREELVGYINKNKLGWTCVSELKEFDNAFARKYQIDGIPWNILLDREGRIVAKNLRGIELLRVLRENMTK